MFGNITIIGVGLIGGSLARALRRADQCRRITGCGRSEAELKKAVALGVIDTYTLDPAAAVAQADIVVLAVPISAMEPVMRAVRGHLPPNAILTDVASAKACVIEAARSAFGDIPERFVPGHPIAGTEHSGVEASFAELFEDRRVVLTPVAQTQRAALERVRALWEVAGATVEEMTPEFHDATLAMTSHLPHVVAYSLVNAVLARTASEDVFRFAGTSFRDATRVAGSDPAMWRDIWLANRPAVLAALAEFEAQVGVLRAAIEQGDGERIRALLAPAQLARQRLQ